MFAWHYPSSSQRYPTQSCCQESFFLWISMRNVRWETKCAFPAGGSYSCWPQKGGVGSQRRDEWSNGWWKMGKNEGRAGVLTYSTEKTEQNKVCNFWVTPGHTINHIKLPLHLCSVKKRRSLVFVSFQQGSQTCQWCSEVYFVSTHH